VLRISREGVRKTLVHLTRLDSYGVAWRSFMELFFDSCGVMRDVVISITATLAEQERISISERTKAGLVRAVKAGRTLGRRPVAVDLVRARKMQKEGLGLRLVAKKLGAYYHASFGGMAPPTEEPRTLQREFDCLTSSNSTNERPRVQ
jgi:DNA invertase Pin-like site-specific DNA recombinase